MTSADPEPTPATRRAAEGPVGPRRDDTPRRSRVFRRIAFVLVLAIVSLGLTLGAAEIALRLWFWGGGERTLGGPGGVQFQHEFTEDGRRAPLATGPKAVGVERILVQGDSIAWGVGIHRWQATFPNLLLALLNREGLRYDLAVLAEPGREIDGHLSSLRERGPEVQPDVLVYQWFVNDIEVENRRPPGSRTWQSWSGHQALCQRSYLYFFLDWRLATLLRPPGGSYVDHILTTYAPGTEPWSEFLHLFHNWAVNAAHLAPRRLLLLYPQVPFRGTYPLEPVHERMKKLAGPHVYTIPAWTLRRRVGNSVKDSDSTYGVSRRLREGEPGGWLFSGPGLAMLRGRHTVLARLRLDAPHAGAVGRLEVIQDRGERILATRVLEPADFPEVGAWTILDVPFVVDADIVQDVEFRLWAENGVQVSADTLSLSVDYGLEVVDPIDELNTFDTHASIFDSHPNERAHELLARVLADAISRKK